MKALKFNEFLTESFNAETPDGDAFGNFALKLLAARDQAHVFHWQTDSFARHEAFGEFYEEFLTNFDAMVEMIMGLKGRPTFGEGASIMISDYSPENINRFFERIYPVFDNELKMICDSNIHEEIFDQARVIISQIDKLKYLLTLS
jgi:DNA-binding ferritin-like protein